MEPIVLASASPRRTRLLAQAHVPHTVEVAGVDESLPSGLEPGRAAMLLAQRKARAVAERLALGGTDRRWIIGSDTIVALPCEGSAAGSWSFLGKPADATEAARMLGDLSSTRHAVVTGVAVLRLPEFAAETACETTWVTMRAIEPDEVSAYVDSGEWRDKAGGYAIQETADRFVVRLAGGGFDNVVGLPVALTLKLLAGLGAPLPG